MSTATRTAPARGPLRSLRTAFAWKLPDACRALDNLAWRIAPWDQPASEAQLIDDYYRMGHLMGYEAGRRGEVPIFHW